MSILVATGRGAHLGVLFRDAAAIERLREVDTVLVDKTGTLTVGRPELTDVVALEGATEDEVVGLAAAVERGSEHPLAAAVVRGAEARGVAVPKAFLFRSTTGKGVAATVGGRKVTLGGERLGELTGDALPDAAVQAAAALRARGRTALYVAVERRGVVGVLGVADPIKPTSKEAVDRLRAHGVHVVMVTGDAEATARAVASELGIDEVIAGVLPEAKADVVARLQGEGRVVAMAGDGVNDAPALARADVGVAMGTGTDVAMESAQVVLVKGDLAALLRARALSEATLRNIRQNLVFAFGYNTIGIPVAAGVLYPVFGVLLSPMLAAAAMSLSSVSVIGNALRLRRTVLG
jgi:Cu+-exporting ATPase